MLWCHGPWSSSLCHANLMAVNDCNRRLPRGLTCVVYAEGDRIINAPPNYSAFIQTTPNNIIIQSKPIPAQNTEPEKLINEAQDLKKAILKLEILFHSIYSIQPSFI